MIIPKNDSWRTYQSLITDWVKKVFDDATRTNIKERSLRVVEEAAELAQACGVERSTVHRLVDYVYGRPVGDPQQEIGGILVTAYAAAHALHVDGDTAFETEIARIQDPAVIERIQKRQLEKRAAMVTADTTDMTASEAFENIARIAAKTRCPSVSPTSETRCELDVSHVGIHIGYGPAGMSDERVWR